VQNIGKKEEFMRLFNRVIAAALLTGTQVSAQTPQSTQAPVPAPQVPTRVAAGTLTNLCGQERSSCLTYVLGAADAFAAALAAAKRPQIFCIPKGTTNDQMAQAAVRYMRANPNEANSNGALVVVAGLAAAYPCGY
jgi:hypothetical protein